MSSIVEGNSQMALMYGRDTFYFALGIAVGMSAAWSICYFGRTVRKNRMPADILLYIVFSISSACGLFASIP